MSGYGVAPRLAAVSAVGAAVLAMVSGASVSGVSVSGASVSGASVSGVSSGASPGVVGRAGAAALPAGGSAPRHQPKFRPASRPQSRPQSEGQSGPQPPVPAPYVHPFADQSDVPTEAAAPSAGVVYSEAAEVDGCDHNYGVPGQCVPWNFPPGVTDRCAWLVEHGLGAVTVSGRDRQRLDTNRDGVACGHGDT
ncbi:hypothetical protein HC031_22875 [Planosporangium thailandense]|uniref:Excalibur calcium-binding domain-containing protein n=1 Tax=Planosporangium thailandense TaxID=765197 RepID=A0ABX0Y2E6_9ACTN|nr:hypothetical protein [Planosporangium thailandense]NJC72539.1 hypothetical protein [Planosporangium thailandense]